eukprot:644115-Rhodomonas_salina.3
MGITLRVASSPYAYPHRQLTSTPPFAGTTRRPSTGQSRFRGASPCRCRPSLAARAGCEASLWCQHARWVSAGAECGLARMRRQTLQHRSRCQPPGAVAATRR